MKMSGFNNNRFDEVISFSADVLSPFKRIIGAAFIVLSPLVSILAGPAGVKKISCLIEKRYGFLIKK